MAKKMAKFIYQSIPKECETVFIEGYVFMNEMFYSNFMKLCKENEVRIWQTELVSG